MNRIILQFTAWLDLAGYAYNSLQSHRLDIKHFMAWLAVKEHTIPDDLAMLKHADLHNYCTELAQRLKPRSVSRHLSSLRLFFNFLQQHGIITDNPSHRLSAPALPPSPPLPLDPNQVRLLLNAPCPSTNKGMRDATLLALLYHYGLKLTELTSLNTADVLLEARALKITGCRARLLPLSAENCSLLADYLTTARPQLLKFQPAPWLFPSRSGKRLDRIGVWRLINRHARQIGITHFTPRRLRHALAIQMLKDGTELATIKQLFGYKRREGSAIYAHITPKSSRLTSG